VIKASVTAWVSFASTSLASYKVTCKSNIRKLFHLIEFFFVVVILLMLDGKKEKEKVKHDCIAPYIYHLCLCP
jgi:uncharacterized membrane protein